MRERLVNIAVITLVISAVGTTAATVRRELTRSSRTAIRVPEPRTQADWLSYATAGQVIGAADASITIVEFADFQCSFCRAFKRDMHVLRKRYPNEIRVIFRHFPLTSHSFAVTAARASECAAEQGRFEAMHDALFESQDSIGVVDWSSFAKSAGVSDLDRFDACVRRSGPIPALERDVAAGHRLGIKGTPTLLINGLRIDGTPGLDSLIAYIERARVAATAPR